MPKYLVIVESPAKCRTINKYLGPEYVVKSSMGHVMDLPKKELGVNISHDFKPTYVNVTGRKKVISDLTKAAKTAEKIYLAPDPDREGEAIAWHLSNLLKADDKDAEKRFFRVTFNQITQKAVNDAFKHPTQLDMAKVNAQQARRILDRIVGYRISPLLWEKIGSGLSAGRVQSVAMRLICEREAEIKIFKSEEYWSVVAELKKEGEDVFLAKLDKINGKKADIKNETQARTIVEDLQKSSYVVHDVQKRQKKRNPFPPLTTSQLQQQGVNKLRFTAQRVMRVAQQLYEGVDLGKEGSVGLITYMRTDSVRVAPEAQKATAEFIVSNFGKDYLPQKPPVYTTRKKNTQEAHESIRPTFIEKTPQEMKKFLTTEQMRLYTLIWRQFLASQMLPAQLEIVSVDIKAGDCMLRASGTTVIFDGFLAAFKDETEEKKADEDEKNGDESQAEDESLIPPLGVNDALELVTLNPNQHFTKPPPRYSEATLVKALEEHGIGRPSTYASIIATIQNRDYVHKENRRFFPTPVGEVVNDLLVKHFPDIINVEFTALMEEKLDGIEEEHTDWVSVMKEFYEKFDSDLKKAKEKLRGMRKVSIPTDHVCDKCGKPMVIKLGRFGQFLSCGEYPKCTFSKPITTMVKCPQENCDGELVARRARGRTFYGCSKYPKCEYKANKLPKSQNEDDVDENDKKV
ncbi:type I DNA topoisomerase [PVC group bacterium]|nr:type I DNA topoisomerase [PVC group bacterium]